MLSTAARIFVDSYDDFSYLVEKVSINYENWTACPEQGRNRDMKDLANSEIISRRDREALIKLKEIVRRTIPTATVLLYGSVARGSQDEESDYDVLILTDLPLSTKEEDAVTDDVYDLELEQGIVISTLFYAKDFWAAPLAQVMPFHQRVQEDGVVI